MRATRKLNNDAFIFKTGDNDAVLDMTDVAYLNFGDSPWGPRQMARETTQRVFEHLAFHPTTSRLRLTQLGDKGWVGIESETTGSSQTEPLPLSSEGISIQDAGVITGDPRQPQLDHSTFVCLAWMAGAFWRGQSLVFPARATMEDHLEGIGSPTTSSPSSLARLLLPHIGTLPPTPQEITPWMHQILDEAS